MTPDRRRAALALALLLAAVGASACGDESCGPGDAPAAGITFAVEDRTAAFGGFTSSPNNDCTAGTVTSLTVEGFQQGASDDRRLLLCLPAPDRLGAGPVALTDASLIQVIDFFADDDGCSLRLDRDRPLAGTAELTGLCADGTDPAGYALELDAGLPLLRTCGADETEVSGELVGRVAVTAD